VTDSPAPAAKAPKPEVAAWGAPLDKLNRLWVRIEQRLAVWAIVTEIATLVLWVSMKGLAAYYTPGGNVIGLIYRSIVSAIVLGFVAHLLTRPKKGAPPSLKNAVIVTTAVVIGLFLGRAWVHLGVAWFSNATAWLQNASVLMLIGGPRGLVTRLTLLVALLGASMAASKGKHINIDIATRYFPARLVKPIGIIGWTAAALVCFAASFGFLDSIAVTKFRAEAFTSCATGICDTTVGQRLGVAAEGVASDFFLFRKQLALDLRTIPHVLAGEPYDRYLAASDWNRWIREGGWEDHFPKEAVASLMQPEDDPAATKMPAVVAPTTGESRDLLIRDLNFVLPFGLLVIALKFLLRILLVASGQVRFDPEAAHEEEDLVHAHDHDAEIASLEKGSAG
jgi:hypothetical protein